MFRRFRRPWEIQVTSGVTVKGKVKSQGMVEEVHPPTQQENIMTPCLLFLSLILRLSGVAEWVNIFYLLEFLGNKPH